MKLAILIFTLQLAGVGLMTYEAEAQVVVPAEEVVPVEEGVSTPVVEPSKVVTPDPKPKAQRNRNVEKETDGTEALGRFKADPVIRSEYQHNGERLEVDPD